MARLQQEIETLKAERAPGDKVKASVSPFWLRRLQQFGAMILPWETKTAIHSSQKGRCQAKGGLLSKSSLVNKVCFLGLVRGAWGVTKACSAAETHFSQ